MMYALAVVMQSLVVLLLLIAWMQMEVVFGTDNWLIRTYVRIAPWRCR